MLRAPTPLRASEWWGSKVGLAVAAGYLAALRADRDVVEVLPDLGLALAALGAGAAYVSVLNDVTDLELDRRAGKPNRLAGHAPRARRVMLGACVGACAAAGALVTTRSPAAGLAFAGAFGAFTAYSAPPLRLKARGVPGLAADAAGAHVLPVLLVVELVGADAGWRAAVLTWASAAGLRAALCHQLSDLEADRRTGVGTAAARHPRSARAVGTWGLFPVETAALGLVVAMAAPAALVAVPPYLALEWMRSRRLQVRVEALPSGVPNRLALMSFYAAYLPAGALAAAVVRDRRALAVGAGHLALFHQELRWNLHEARVAWAVRDHGAG